MFLNIISYFRLIVKGKTRFSFGKIGILWYFYQFFLFSVFFFISLFFPQKTVKATADNPYGWEILSAYTTYFNQNEGGRCENIAIAAALIDGVTITDADHPDPLNYMYFGDFEKSTEIPKIDWKKDERFIYKEEKK